MNCMGNVFFLFCFWRDVIGTLIGEKLFSWAGCFLSCLGRFGDALGVVEEKFRVVPEQQQLRASGTLSKRPKNTSTIGTRGLSEVPFGAPVIEARRDSAHAGRTGLQLCPLPPWKSALRPPRALERRTVALLSLHDK